MAGAQFRIQLYKVNHPIPHPNTVLPLVAQTLLETLRKMGGSETSSASGTGHQSHILRIEALRSINQALEKGPGVPAIIGRRAKNKGTALLFAQRGEVHTTITSAWSRVMIQVLALIRCIAMIFAHPSNIVFDVMLHHFKTAYMYIPSYCTPMFGSRLAGFMLPGFHSCFQGRQKTARRSQTQRLKPNSHCCWE